MRSSTTRASSSRARSKTPTRRWSATSSRAFMLASRGIQPVHSCAPSSAMRWPSATCRRTYLRRSTRRRRSCGGIDCPVEEANLPFLGSELQKQPVDHSHLVDRLRDLSCPGKKIGYLVQSWLRRTAVITEIADVGEVLNEPPLRNVDCAPRLQRLVEISNSRALLSSRQLAIRANLT